MANSKRLIVIDSNALIHRAYHALPPLTAKNGELVNAVYGFLLIFLKAIKELHPEYIVACFDFPGKNFRHEQYRDYKAKRPKAPEDLYAQISKLKNIIKNFNVLVLEKEGFEADDLIGTVSKLAQEDKEVQIETFILSSDNDMLQLVDLYTRVYSLKKGVKDTVIYDEKGVREKYQGLNPIQLIDYKALRGDPSDNVPGAKGIGEKGAIGLIKNFGSLENLYKELEKGSVKTQALKPRMKEILVQQKEQTFFSKMLVTIKRDVLADFSLENCRWKGYDKEKVIDSFRDLGFLSLIERLP